MKIRLGVLYGSKTVEHDVSIISGLQAAYAAEDTYDVTRIYIDREGKWFVGDALKDIKFYSQPDETKITHVLPLGENGKLLLIKYPGEGKRLFASERTVLHTIDVALPVMHGMNGEDGTLSGMLELMDVPYAASGVLGSSVGMDKIAMKRLLCGLGLPVLEDTWIERAQWREDPEQCIAQVEKALPYPVYVKPANLGSSIGINRADDRDGLERAIETAVCYDRRVLIERGVQKRKEVNCSVLGYAGDVRASVLEMPVCDKDEDLLTFEVKYTRHAKGASEGMRSLARLIPAPIPDDMTKTVQAQSIELFRALDCKGVTRVDWIIDEEENKLYLGEINTIPGSLSFYLWEASGMTFAQMIDKMVECALNAASDRRASVFSHKSEILQQVVAGAKGAKTGK